jgi:hypothetical protein
VVDELHFPSKLFHNHLAYCEAEANTILIDVIDDSELSEHLADQAWVLEPDTMVTYLNLQHIVIILILTTLLGT